MANKVLAEFRTKLDQVLEDDAGRLSQAKRDAALQEAVIEYSRYRPAIKVFEYSGDGHTFDIPLGTAPGPTDWQADFSVVRQVEYPSGQRTPVILERDAWMEYQSPTGLVLRLLADTPPVGTKARISYAILRTLTAAAGTLPDADFDAVANLAASYAALWIGMSFAQSGDPTIAADSVDHKSKSSEYSQKSREFRALFFKHMGITDEKGAPPASVTQDWDQTPGSGDYLTHPKEWR